MFCLVFFCPARIIAAELGRPVTMVSEVGRWLSNPCVYFQKQLLHPRQKYLLMKFFCKIYWFPYFLKFVHECSFVVGIHLCVITSKAAFHYLCAHLCPYSTLMQHLWHQRHLEPIILMGDARSGRSGMLRSTWFQHEQSIAWRPTVQQRSPPFPIQRTIWKGPDQKSKQLKIH